MCAINCPDVFFIKEDGKSDVKTDEVARKEDPKKIQEAINMCPVQAIQWAQS